MNSDQFLTDAAKTAKIIDALHKARYAMVVVDGNTARCEGSDFRLDFKSEIDLIDEVMTMLGIDMTEPLPAPVNWRDGDEE
jgi:phenylalanyl-tRNA synthetase beta subunit